MLGLYALEENGYTSPGYLCELIGDCFTYSGLAIEEEAF